MMHYNLHTAEGAMPTLLLCSARVCQQTQVLKQSRQSIGENEER